MDKMPFLRAMALMVMAFAMARDLRAQQPVNALVAYQVSGLTSADRDQLALQADQGGVVKLTFACVPAGILVFEPVNGAARADLGTQVEGLITQRMGRANVVAATNDRQQLEALCATARNN